jgi:hypothetical protein
MRRITVVFAIAAVTLRTLVGCAGQADPPGVETTGNGGTATVSGDSPAPAAAPGAGGSVAPAGGEAGGAAGMAAGMAGTPGSAGADAVQGSDAGDDDGASGMAGASAMAGSGGAAGSGAQAGTGGAAGMSGAAGTTGAAGAAGSAPAPMPLYLPSPNNPAECPAVAPENPVGDCLGLPVYLVCEYGDDVYWYVCTCDWYHWLCAGT